MNTLPDTPIADAISGHAEGRSLKNGKLPIPRFRDSRQLGPPLGLSLAALIRILPGAACRISPKYANSELLPEAALAPPAAKLKLRYTDANSRVTRRRANFSKWGSVDHHKTLS